MLGLLNAKEDLKAALVKAWSVNNVMELDKPISPHPQLNSLFIDWFPKKTDDKFATQAVYVEHYAKAGVPIVIFDRFLSVNQTEYSWLRKFNITFCEPVIGYRTGFKWMPLWSDRFIPKRRDKSKYILTGELDNAVLEDFDKYYKRAAELLPSKSVSYSLKEADIYDSKIDSLHQLGIEKLERPVYDQAATTILIGCANDYKHGRLPDNFFDIMREGCVPLLPIEHRFYCSMFDDLTISNDNDLIFLLEMSERVAEVLIEELLENIFKRYPEFHIRYTVEQLKEWLV